MKWTCKSRLRPGRRGRRRESCRGCWCSLRDPRCQSRIQLNSLGEIAIGLSRVAHLPEQKAQIQQDVGIVGISCVQLLVEGQGGPWRRGRVEDGKIEERRLVVRVDQERLLIGGGGIGHVVPLLVYDTEVIVCVHVEWVGLDRGLVVLNREGAVALLLGLQSLIDQTVSGTRCRLLRAAAAYDDERARKQRQRETNGTVPQGDWPVRLVVFQLPRFPDATSDPTLSVTSRLVAGRLDSGLWADTVRSRVESRLDTGPRHPPTPRVTVFTPSHEARFLDSCLQTLLAQTLGDWEWIVVLNHGARWQPKVEDRRIHVLIKDDVVGVGEAKHLACTQAQGEFLVELDHDDELKHNALERIVETFDADPRVGLVYSNCAQITEDGARDETRWDEANGWIYSDVDVDGRAVLQVASLQPFPHNVSYIWFAPNHVRAFRHSIYRQAGGYDPGRDILDDQDLMCRMYLHGDFRHIDECLYLQRWHASNTQRVSDLNARIQVETVELYDRYIEPCTLAWSLRRGLQALDLGAAHNKAPGYRGVDLRPGAGVDLVADLTKGIPFPTSSVGLIRAVDFLPQIPDKTALFNEICRVLAHGGLLLSDSPSSDGRGAFQDPTHVAYYNENSFWYFTDRDFARFVPELRGRFQFSRLKTYFRGDWYKEHNIPYVLANLVAIKDGPRQGGIARM